MMLTRHIRLAAPVVVSAGLAAGMLLATTTSASAAPAAGHPAPRLAADCTWTAQLLPSLVDGGFSQIHGTDGAATWAGVADDAGFNDHAALWRNGRLIRLAEPADAQSTQANDVNRRGTAAGFSTVAGGRAHALEWRDGRAIRLAEPAGAVDSQATGINDAGLIVGWATLADNYTHPVVWSADRPGQARVLASTPGRFTYLRGVSETGVLVGVQTDFSTQDALVGTVRTGLRVLPGTVPGALTAATAVAGRHVVGFQAVLDAPGQSGAVSWQSGRPTLLSGGSIDEATAVNTAGLIAGSSFEAGAVVWQRGTTTVLPTGSGGAAAADAVSEDGTVGGWSLATSGNSTATLWSCR
jgi:uncharacterized membrane protein